MALLSVSGICKESKKDFAVKNISFNQQPLEKIAIAGETGSGKTTLLKLIGGLLQPDAGEMRFENKRIIGPYDQLIPGHPGIAYLSQHFELRNNYWVHEILGYANQLTNEEASELYTICRIDHLLERRTDQLSGGEKQRIALARLLTGAPKLLLLDEPFSNLDFVHKQIIKSVIDDIGSRLNISCIMVSHDAADILSWADTVLVMKDGTLIQQGTPEQIYHQPVDEYCAGLLGPFNLINGMLATALAETYGIALNDRRLLVRPGNCYITTADEINDHKGIVQDILFCGSFYSIGVRIDEQLLNVTTNSKRFTVGDTVYLKFSPENVWCI